MGRLRLALVLLAACGSDGGTTTSVPVLDGGTASDGGSVVVVVAAVEGPIAQVCGGGYHTCARLKTGALYCWGQGAYRQLGGDYGAKHVATKVEGIEDAEAIDCGARFTCAVRKGGAVWCWGDDDHGQAGTATTKPCGDATIDSICVPTPAPIVGLESDVVQLALGVDHACALRHDGAVLCWGDNARGQTGATALSDVKAPTAVVGIAGTTRIAAGDTHTCALAAGKVTCWGSNTNGQIGAGKVGDPIPVPSEVAGVDDAMEIAAGGEHTCALRTTGEVVCWGYDYLGQLGNGSTRPTRTTMPQKVVGLTDAVELTAGRYHTCARKKSGAVACWGNNGKGQIGDGSTDDRSAPVDVADISATLVTAGAWHACTATIEGKMWCWGDDLGAQLGDDRVAGTPTPRPVAVQGLPN